MIRRGRFQNRVAEGVFALPVCVVLSLLMWYLPKQEVDAYGALGWILCALVTYISMETNTVHYLIRIRTRMVACTWILLASALPFLHVPDKPIVCALCFALAHYLLFRCYLSSDSVVSVFHCFLFIGLAALCVPSLLCFGVLFFFYFGALMHSLSWRSFWAGVIGLALPWWGWTAWCLYTEEWSTMSAHFLNAWQFQFPDLSAHTVPELAFWAYITLLSLVGTIHFLLTRYKDKIRVRVMLSVYIIQMLAVQLFMLFCPASFPELMALLLLSASPLVAHFFALTRSRFSNIFFIISLVALVVLAVQNLW